MERVRNYCPEKRPKILGLSATLLNANVKNDTVDLNKKLKELERVFDGEIVTSSKYNEVRER